MGKKIIVNGSIIHEKPTGLGIYAINIIKELSKDKNIEVYSPVDIDGVDSKKISKYVKPSYKKNRWTYEVFMDSICFTL